ncbi:MAG: Trk system potassium transporter TrkA [Longimicrobiales bacterium]|nr:Trk system potassium transporter TrkA [Longimicrobiales bacterium]
MRVLIVGAGEVGFHLAERLSQEGQDVVLLEQDPERADFASKQLDVLTLAGNGASLPVLEKAGVKGARILLAVTSQDEVNLISCLAASRMGVEFTVARVSNPEYFQRGSVLSGDQMGIDLLINPERECAWETFQLLQAAAATDVAQFAQGRVELLGVRVKEGAPVAGRTLAEVGVELKDLHYNTVAIRRGDRTIIPRGADRVLVGDQIYVLAPTEEVGRIHQLAGHEDFELRRVMIAGGSEEGAYLAEMLEQNGIECTILDHDRRRCLELAERLPRSLVLHADATDLELLEMEGVAGIDGFVACTGQDETNMLASLLAKSVGARKVVSLVHRFAYLSIVAKVGIDAAVSPRMSTVNAILRYVRRGRVLTVAALQGIDAEAIEFSVGPGAPIVGRPLHEVQIPAGAFIGTILRGEEIILPRGGDCIQAGDEVIVFTLPEAISRVERLFAE